MDFSIVILYDEHGFHQPNDERFLKGRRQKLSQGNIEFYLIVDKGTGSIPTLIFEKAKDEIIFFDNINKWQSVNVFTTLLPDQLKYFHDQAFRDTSGAYQIKCLIKPVFDGSQSTAGRWLEFQRDVYNPNGIAPASRVGIAGGYQTNGHKSYASPLIALDYQPQLYYHTLFKNRKDLPLALPPFKSVPLKTYFGAYVLPGKPEAHIFDIRKKFKDQIFAYEKVNTECLFARLWLMTDDPVFAEYLKDGSYFNFHSKEENAGEIQSQELGGLPFISFNYANARLYNDDELKQWKGEMLELYTADNSIDKIKQALKSDLADAIPSHEYKIVKAQNEIINDWGKFSDYTFDNQKARGLTGYWTQIEKLSDQFDDDVKEFIKELILNPSKSQGRIAHDHDLALHLFSYYLCRFPFNEVESDPDRWISYVPPNFQAEWKSFFFDFVCSKTILSPQSIDNEIILEPGKCTFSSFLSPLQIFRLRLMLPPDTDIKIPFSPVLNSTCVLDSSTLD